MTDASTRDDATREPEPDDPVGLVRPEQVRLTVDAFERLHLAVDGRQFDNVRAVRAFPLSAKADYVSFLNDDRKEVALLACPDKLDKASREVLETALEKMYYVPKIRRIYSITETMGISQWEVMTDRGFACFEVVDREHIRRLPGGRYLLGDVDGNRFEIENVGRLDARSQALAYSEI